MGNMALGKDGLKLLNFLKMAKEALQLLKKIVGNIWEMSLPRFAYVYAAS